MSTAPAPDPAPFDPHAFPADLVAAQRQAAELHAALHAHQTSLPWSREPHPGWPEVAERGREHPGRAASPGWTPQEATRFDQLLVALRDARAAVQGHPWWARCRAEGIEGADLVAARQALKHAPGAVPVARGDVDAAA
ncbi:hypothetical protein [Streptomyces similanensis]|uniref:Uncharacterized protein n=1 Tax=Streptomyces similanensis TaxID=1274988 RepID=A0ABP9L7S1_9ACTN